ncbi:MAG: sulfotransferase [Pseudomonadota bacterium]
MSRLVPVFLTGFTFGFQPSAQLSLSFKPDYNAVMTHSDDPKTSAVATSFPTGSQAPWQPVVIGATGGSGTRAFHGIMGALGLFMGTRVNGAGDAMDFEPFLDRWINPLISKQRSLDYDWHQVSWWDRRRVSKSFTAAMHRFQADRTNNQPWGWKNPRSMYVLPAIAATTPGIRFIHVLRDGRDMAFSDNQNQRRKHYAALFGADTMNGQTAETPAASAALWAAANGQVADWCDQHLGALRYYRIRFEDLCADPGNEVARLALWLFGQRRVLDQQVSAAAATVQRAPSTMGRWRQQPIGDQTAVTEAAAPALKRFGYMTEETEKLL